MVIEEKHNSKKTRHKVNILGEELVVIGDISEDYVEELAKYVNKMGEEILNAYPRLPRRHLLGLTMINITDELYKLRKTHFDRQRKIKKLKKEREKLKQEVKRLKEDNRELSALLEEVDG